MKLYIAGPMRGHANFNVGAFRSAATDLRALGHEVVSPVEMTIALYGAEVYQDNPTGDESRTKIDPGRVFFNDLKAICLEVEGVVLLPGWERSKGARAEFAAAEALGKPTFKLETLLD